MCHKVVWTGFWLTRILTITADLIDHAGQYLLTVIRLFLGLFYKYSKTEVLAIQFFHRCKIAFAPPLNIWYYDRNAIMRVIGSLWKLVLSYISLLELSCCFFLRDCMSGTGGEGGCKIILNIIIILVVVVFYLYWSKCHNITLLNHLKHAIVSAFFVSKNLWSKLRGWFLQHVSHIVQLYLTFFMSWWFIFKIGIKSKDLQWRTLIQKLPLTCSLARETSKC